MAGKVLTKFDERARDFIGSTHSVSARGSNMTAKAMISSRSRRLHLCRLRRLQATSIILHLGASDREWLRVCV
jgi:hypothetical protein